MKLELLRVPVERVEKVIFLIRGEKVIPDRDLASLYAVSTKSLKQAVRRNIERFPEDFMFTLSASGFENWRSQFVTSNADRMGLRYPPMAFTEQGVAMRKGRRLRASPLTISSSRTFGGSLQ